MYRTTSIKPNGKFGNWLFDNMMQRNWTCGDVARILHSTRQNIRNHVIGRSKPQYVWVIAYCSIFNHDPDEIWKIVLEEF